MLRAIVLAAALLLAQHAALSHDIWHGAGASQTGGQGKLCKLHDALGTVIGVVDAAPAAITLLVQAQVFVRKAVAEVRLATPSPSSRDPPALL
jgi:hypothetical protein